jgi:hypothetical protein
MSRIDSPLRNRLLFLVGTQRSGTNWLQGLLRLHPDVVALPTETHLLSTGMHILRQFTHQGPMESYVTSRLFMERDAFADAARDFCDVAFGQLAAKLDPTATYILERTPNSAERMDLVAEIYPDGRAVHIIRDGRDVARSLLAMPWGPKTLADAARTWRHAVETARTYGPQMSAYAEVRYEDLMADPSKTYTHILEIIHLPVDDATVDAALFEAAIPVNLDRTKPAVGSGKWLKTWTPEDLAAFDAEAGDLLYDVLGYPRLKPEPSRPTLITRAGRRVRRLRPAPAAKPPETTSLGSAAEQRISNDLVGLLADGQIDEAISSLAPDAFVRVVTADGEWRGRGAEAIDQLRTVLEKERHADTAGWGRQLRGHVHFMPPMTTSVLRYERGGELTDRVIVTHVRDGRISRLAYYRFDAAT